MKCPNCSAECSDQALECDFCGHALVAGADKTAAPEMMATPMPPTPPMAAEPAPPTATPYQNTSNAPAPKAAVENHMVWAIASTAIATIVTMLTCCCIPLGLPSGIAAIVFASKVTKLLETGNIVGAEQAAKTAKLWCWVTTAIAIIFGILFVLSMVLQTMGYIDKDYLEDLRKQMEAGR